MQERNSKQEEALFTLLMDQVARQENQQAREAMERLARDPSAAVPALSQRRKNGANTPPNTRPRSSRPSGTPTDR